MDTSGTFCVACHSSNLFTVIQFVAEPGTDVPEQTSLLRIELLHAENQADCQILIYIVIFQTGGPDLVMVTTHDRINAEQMLLYNAIALGNRIAVFHDAFLSGSGIQKRQ